MLNMSALACREKPLAEGEPPLQRQIDPLYLPDPNAGGAQIINKAAFSIPASGQGDLGRNALRGFGASQERTCRTFPLSATELERQLDVNCPLDI